MSGSSQDRAIDFYFDFSSPYSYIASEWIEALAARHARTVRWHAVLLGALFQPAELRPPVAHPIKREYVMRDFARSARFAGVPYQQPAQFPIPTQNAARVFCWLHGRDPAQAVSWAHAALRGYFARNVPLNDPVALRSLVQEAGVNPDEAEAAWSDPVWKECLKRENDAASALGVFGAPFFRIDGEPFWGHDRQAQMDRWLSMGPY